MAARSSEQPGKETAVRDVPGSICKGPISNLHSFPSKGTRGGTVLGAGYVICIRSHRFISFSFPPTDTLKQSLVLRPHFIP